MNDPIQLAIHGLGVPDEPLSAINERARIRALKARGVDMRGIYIVTCTVAIEVPVLAETAAEAAAVIGASWSEIRDEIGLDCPVEVDARRVPNLAALPNDYADMSPYRSNPDEPEQTCAQILAAQEATTP